MNWENLGAFACGVKPRELGHQRPMSMHRSSPGRTFIWMPRLDTRHAVARYFDAMLKLNIGCGSNHLPGYLNIDSFSGCAPDKLLDLEQVPWDFDDNSVDEIVATHVLEHLGQQTSVFSGVIKELYRVLCHGGQAHIAVPHHFHPTFLATQRMSGRSPEPPSKCLIVKKTWIGSRAR